MSLGGDAPTGRALEPPSARDVVALPPIGGLQHRYSRGSSNRPNDLPSPQLVRGALAFARRGAREARPLLEGALVLLEPAAGNVVPLKRPGG